MLADELAEQSNGFVGEVPPWQYYRAPWYCSLERGLVWRYMARHDVRYALTAVADLAGGFAGMPAEMASADWAAEYRVSLAHAYALAGDVAAAQSELAVARAAAEKARSKRVLQMIKGTERAVAG